MYSNNKEYKKDFDAYEKKAAELEVLEKERHTFMPHKDPVRAKKIEQAQNEIWKTLDQLASKWDDPNFGNRYLLEKLNAVPDAPFKKDWHKMIARDMVSDAVARDMQGVSWNTAEILRQRYPNVKADFEKIYDQRMVKFFENEMGVKPKKVKTQAIQKIKAMQERGQLEVWYVPLTEKMKRLYKSEEPNILPADPATASAMRILNERKKKAELEGFNIKANKIQAQIDRYGSRAVDQIITIPAQQSVFEILLAPLRNQRGQITLDFGKRKKDLSRVSREEMLKSPRAMESLREQLGPERLERIRQLGLEAEREGKGLAEYMQAKGLSAKAAKELEQVHLASKVDKPFESALAREPMPEGIDPLEFLPTDRNVNTTRSKKTKAQVPIAERVLREVERLPKLKLPALVRGWITAPIQFKKYKSPFMMEIWHKSHTIERARLQDQKVLEAKYKDIMKRYPDEKLHEEAWIKLMSKDEINRKLVIASGRKPIFHEIAYDPLLVEMKELFDGLGNRVQQTRAQIGLKPFKMMENYAPMFARETLYDSLRKIFVEDEFVTKETQGKPNLVLDSPEMVAHRHQASVADQTLFPHIKRGFLRPGVKLETSLPKLYLKYGNTALRHVHYSPLNAFIEQLTTRPLKDPTTQKLWNMRVHNPDLAEFLGRWSNKLAGRPNVMLPEQLRFVENAASKLSNNLTLATLGWSVRTVLVQPTALIPTMTEFGVGATTRGVMDTMIQRKNAPIEKSDLLAIRTATVEINDLMQLHGKGKVRQLASLPAQKALSAMKVVDSVIAEAAWRTAYAKARKTMTEKQAIKFADEATVRTQGSGFAGDLSPIQMNAIGKAITLWQTYTINHINWLATEVLNIKHPERTPGETARRVLTYTIGTALINTLFEDQFGVQSPMPAPGKAFLKALDEGEEVPVALYLSVLEALEILPIGASLKYGSDPLGAVAQWGADMSEAAAKELPRALSGNKTAMRKLLFLTMKTVGVPGTQQIKRVVEGTEREETPFGAVMGRYTEEKAAKLRGKRAAETRSRNKQGSSSSGMKGWSGSGKATGMKGWN